MSLKKIIEIALAGISGIIIHEPAQAIINATPDNGSHPNVAFLALGDNLGNLTRCSGILLSPTVVLTAAHCMRSNLLDPITGATFAFANFDDQINVDINNLDPFFQSSILGLPFIHPNFDRSVYDLLDPQISNFDVGIVQLSQPVFLESFNYGVLPEVGAVDNNTSATFDVVGYGISVFDPPINPFSLDVDNVTRRQTNFNTNNLENYLELQGGNLVNGEEVGSVCYGDSGGPAFFEGTNTVVAITSFIEDPNCLGTAYSYRIDNPDTLSFINSFLDQENQSIPESTPISGILILGITGISKKIMKRNRKNRNR
ncbi:MAG: trypsin-like serine protease [Crocosphaera sp.]